MHESDSDRNSPDEALIRAVWKEARDLIKHLESTTVQRLAVEAGEYKIEIERGGMTAGEFVVAAPALGGGAGAPATAAAEVVPDNRTAIMSPLVGTFYRSPQPGAPPYIEVGNTVDKGQTVAIVEAMKILNQVEADRPGRVVEVLAKDGDWVEFQQVLMYLEPVEE